MPGKAGNSPLAGVCRVSRRAPAPARRLERWKRRTSLELRTASQRAREETVIAGTSTHMPGAGARNRLSHVWRSEERKLDGDVPAPFESEGETALRRSAVLSPRHASCVS